MHGQAVLQAVHSSGVLGDITADRTGDLRRRIRGVVQAMGRSRLGNRQVAHTGLHAGKAAFGVDFEDPVEARHDQQNAFGQRQGTARQPGASATGDHWHTALVAQLEQRLHLLQAFGQHHHQRHRAISREPVAFIGGEVFRAMQDLKVGQRVTQRLQQCRLVDGRQRAIDPFVVENVHQAHSAAVLVVVPRQHGRACG
ncbi:hypothetical protein D3C79_782590 [compost metagenome]